MRSLEKHENLRDAVEELLLATLTQMIREGMKKGNWGNIRGTADSLIAMDKCLTQRCYKNLRKFACQHITEQVRTDEPDLCWEEEVWDTALAIAALSCDYKKHRKTISSGWSWIKDKYNDLNNNWHDEPWETSWALLALLSILNKDPKNDGAINVAESLQWLVRLIGPPQMSLLINWHYSALFILIVNICEENHYLHGGQHTDLIEELRECRKRILNHVIDYLKTNTHENTLWTHELWSNSLVLWAFCESVHKEQVELLIDAKEVNRIYNWFENTLEDNDDQQHEDRAFACIALFKLTLLIGLNDYKECKQLQNEIARINSLPRERVAAMERFIGDIKETQEGDLKKTLSERLVKDIKLDYTPKPSFKSKDYHLGYVTFNLRENVVIIGLIVFFTALLTSLAYNVQPYVSEKIGQILTKVPAVLGIFMTVLRFANLSPADLFKRGKRSSK